MIHHRILVIGASFGGLTVAQRLLHLQKNNDSSATGNNDDNLLLLNFRIKRVEDDNNDDDGNDPTMIPQQGSMDVLRQGIRIWYSHVVWQIFQNKNVNKLYAVVELQNASGENGKHVTETTMTTTMGPYDAVVLAMGVRFTVTSTAS